MNAAEQPTTPPVQQRIAQHLAEKGRRFARKAREVTAYEAACLQCTMKKRSPEQ